ncbi:PstS family phosphate ABC transporter substrate-binding protein [Gloeocapsopsis dulcis]|uniref:PBP domain-containing protein n=1 Tax=Gloeocapsopsis dulcis AAB1 = 1H9 TaxID=1433147 RepID=A0A6N8G1N6_9CHRO|nr:PstS family phosphate ABC transporter substrate-binding protein [Gloeocapsopsis dulcis]MUL39243.1 hypothetical protein [Gloeocapsopsis dulcis AAB1 = 1H9]WNN88040.1 PstS family phosphate ABC transporter substrate-binding protein [Gloeocapsopsis dulcis]
MDLLLRQLHYTSFAERGCKQLVSKQVTLEVRKAFSDRIVSCYWSASHPPNIGYRCVYLHQISCQQTLFGWLYSDGVEQNSSVIPYFVCYYLDEKLLNFHLETIFTCLQKGPLAIIDRHATPIALETKVVSNLWSYEPARPGVAVSPEILQQCYTALNQGELINLLVPHSTKETVLVLGDQTYEQRIANLSVYQHYIIEGITEEADNLAVPRQVTNYQKIGRSHQPNQLYVQPTQENKQKLSFPVKVAEGSLAIAPHKSSSVTKVSSKKNPLLNSEQRNLSPSSFNQNNLQFLLRIGIIATALAVTLSIYRLVHLSLLTPIASEVKANNNNPVFFKTLTEVSNVPQGIFNYSASPTFASLRPTVSSRLAQAQRQFQLRFVEPVSTAQGSSVGIKMLLDGELSFVLSSRPLRENELAQARQRGFALEQIPIALDGITFFANPRNLLVGLNLSQLQDIFSGKINNWETVGGPDLPITAFSFDPEVSGTADVVQQRVLAGGEFGKNVQITSTAMESILKVADTPGGIGYSSAAVAGQEKIYPLPISIAPGETFISPFVGINEKVLNKAALANGSYPLTRRLFAIVKRDGGLDEQAGVSYVNLLTTDEGQKLIEQAGFVPIR